MAAPLTKKLAVGISLLGTVVICYFAWQSWTMVHAMDRGPASDIPPTKVEAKAEGHGTSKGDKGESKGEAKEAHGEAKAEGKEGGEKPAGEHGESTTVAHAPSNGLTLVSLDQIVSNLRQREKEDEQMRSVWLKLELELFSDDGRKVIENRQSGIRDIVIQVAREQDYRNLGTLPGKLYFKELLVTRINGFLKTATIRDIHFSDFLLQ